MNIEYPIHLFRLALAFYNSRGDNAGHNKSNNDVDEDVI